jgi:hypothetical protein
VSPVKYELGFYIPEYGILHSHGREIFKTYIVLGLLCCLFVGNAANILKEQPAHINREDGSAFTYETCQLHTALVEFPLQCHAFNTSTHLEHTEHKLRQF